MSCALTAAMAVAAAAAGPAGAACSTAATGAACVVPPPDGARAAGTAGRRVTAKSRTPRFAAGDILPPGSYRLLLNSEYYGLPPVRDGWRYYVVGGQVLRVRPETLEVIGDATSETNRAF